MSNQIGTKQLFANIQNNRNITTPTMIDPTPTPLSGVWLVPGIRVSSFIIHNLEPYIHVLLARLSSWTS